MEARADSALDRGAWPATVPAVRQLLDGGLDLGRATVLVGENGAGRSTLVEAIARAFELSAEGGSPNSMRLEVRLLPARRDDAPLSTYLEVPPRGPHGPPEPRFHEMSHGESFLALIRDRFRRTGLRVLDEPESALSMTGCMALLSHLTGLLEDDRNQVLLSTRSPLLAALPNAQILELGEWGPRPSVWEDLELVTLWRAFLDEPRRFLRHL